MNGIEVLAVIPARGGSKGLPRKNIKDLNGKPLISYTIEEAKKSKYINKVVVSTEDEEIAEVSRNFGAEVPYLRPEELAKDNSLTVDCVIHMINWLKENENYIPEYVCVLQCTSPLRTFDDIDGTVEKMISTGMDGAVSVCEAEVNPYWTNIFNGDELVYFLEEGRKISRRQDLPPVYRMNGAIYIAKTQALIEYKTLEPNKITGYIMDADKSVDIDDIKDFMLAEVLIKRKSEEK